MGRHTNKRIIIHSYEMHPSMEDTSCFYCGYFGQSKDHVPPVSYPYDQEEIKRIIVRACLLCNSLLSNKYLLSLLSRCDYLLIRYQVRFRKLLAMPLWKDEEIEELTGKLKRSVILSVKKKKHIEQRILYIQKNIEILQGYSN